MMTVPVRILTVETVLVRKQYGNSTETVRNHYGNTTETLRNSVSTPYCVVHGYPRKARESDVCMYGGRRDQQGCVTVMRVALRLCRVALRLHYGVTIPWPRHGRPRKF